MQITQIKQYLDILTVLTHYGLKPDRNGMLLCPFHDDHTPSLKIYPKTNTFNCFGCGASGDVIEFIQLKEKTTKHQAIEKAKALINPAYTITQKTMKQNSQDVQPAEFTRIATLTKYLQSCKAGIERSKPAQEYCTKRNLNYNKLNIGFNGAALLSRWNDKLKESAVGIGLLSKLPNGVTNFE